VDQYVKENAKVIYIYFDYNAQIIQTEAYIVGILLKQVLCQVSDIPAEIESFYNDSIATSKKSRMTDLVCFLTQHSKSRIYAVFDALDECNDKYQQNMLSLLTLLEKSGFKLLISTRPHLHIDQDQLNSVQTVIIEADATDLKNYVLTTLTVKKNSNRELEARCLELVKEVKGM
jgi:hypothetical protein